MTGIVDQIAKAGKTLEERGIPSHSYFEVVFLDGSVASEKDFNWSDLSEQKDVDFMGSKKTVRVCAQPVARMAIFHDDMVCRIEVPTGCQVYQSIKSRIVGGTEIQQHSIIGRTVGIVKDDKVIEEQYLDAIEGTVKGIKM